MASTIKGKVYLVVEGDDGGGGAGDVVEQEEMLRALEFRREDAVLDERELDVAELEAGFLADLAAEGVGGGFAAFDFAAGDAPAVAPFVGADHQNLAVAVVNQGAHSGDGPRNAAAAV